MKKTIAKVVHHVKHIASPLPEADEPIYATQAPVSDPMHEAIELITKLANSTPAHMGTAHGISLIHAAQAWVAAHVEHE